MIFGAADGVGGTSSSSSSSMPSSSIAVTGGDIANGDGPCDIIAFAGKSPPPPPPPGGDVAGGLVAEAPPGVGMGGLPELNSAQRGHFRFVSVVGEEGQKRPRQTIDRKERGRGGGDLLI